MNKEKVIKDIKCPLFSVIIPCHNVENYVEECLESLVNQTIGIENIEIILVDDCSTDSTIEILQKYESRYSEHILLILLENNVKQGGARNVGLKYATGEYINFVDADDMVRVDLYEILLSLLKNHDCDIVQFRYKIFTEMKELNDDFNTAMNEIMNPDNIRYYEYGKNRKKYLLNSNILNESCTQKLYKRKLLIESGVQYAEGFAYEEPLFTYPLKFYVNNICVLEKPLYYYRRNQQGTSISYMANPKTIFDHLMVQLKLRDFMNACENAKEYRAEMDLYFLHAFYAGSFYFFKLRGWRLPVKLFRFMKQNIEIQVPNYYENRYLDDSSMKEDEMLLDLLKEDLDDLTMQNKIDLALEKVME